MKKLERGIDKSPAISRDKLDAFLKSHLIEPTVRRAGSFHAFMEDRQAKLLALIEQATGKAAYAGNVAEEGVDVEGDEAAEESGRTIAAA